MHCFLTNETVYRSILLSPLRSIPDLPSAILPFQTTSSSANLASDSSSETTSHTDGISESASGKTKSSEISESDKAQVLISISIDSGEIENNQAENVKIWTEILRLLPPAATGIKIQAFYGSFSKLVLIAMPVPVWNALPKIPAYSFVGFITTENMMPQL